MVIDFPTRNPLAEKWIICVSPDIAQERVEDRGDSSLMVYAKSIENVAVLIEKGKDLLVKSAAKRKRR
ncbi:MAG: hypothetical protein K2N78_10960 [Oscillospiraceae bacterium]|nr:hypothetical protein [Oscillospiraceae bacterium]